MSMFNMTEPPSQTVLENQTATLTCPDAAGSDVTWSRFYGDGNKADLLLIKDGYEVRPSLIPHRRFGSLADMKSLTITRVKESDSGIYLCNMKRIYLKVVTDPRLLIATRPPDTGVLITSITGSGPNQKASPSSGYKMGTEEPRYTDYWKVLVGVVIGSALVVTAISTKRYCSKRAVRDTNSDKPMTEVIYEEIRDRGVQPRRESDVETPYLLANAPGMQDAPRPGPPNDNLYASVNKPQTKRLDHNLHMKENCVYFLAQDQEVAGNDTAMLHV